MQLQLIGDVIPTENALSFHDILQRFYTHQRKYQRNGQFEGGLTHSVDTPIWRMAPSQAPALGLLYTHTLGTSTWYDTSDRHDRNLHSRSSKYPYRNNSMSSNTCFFPLLVLCHSPYPKWQMDRWLTVQTFACPRADLEAQQHNVKLRPYRNFVFSVDSTFFVLMYHWSR